MGNLGEEMLREQIEALQRSVAEILDAVQKIAVIEERFINQKETTQRIFERISDAENVSRSLEARLRLLETSNPLHDRTGRWVEYLLTGIVGGAGAIILGRLVH
jgi:hypothetical protein